MKMKYSVVWDQYLTQEVVDEMVSKRVAQAYVADLVEICKSLLP